MADVQENKNALWRRDEQIKRYNMSETYTESSDPRNQDNVKVKFEDSCVFLAACSSGDIREVEILLAKGADINTANIDGLTALHQACIDDKLPMVRFLVEHDADIDAYDNEGWTPLHATGSCGFLDIARFLIEKGANIAAVNNDGELALDLAEGQAMEDLLQDEMDKQGVDADAARDEEENMMLRDANQWLSNGYDEEPHQKTGATALHCAAAKGYTKVMDVLIQANADVDAQDLDGWTPLHAAAHWCMDEACKILVEHLCNMEVTNNSGQTAMDIVDPDIEDILKELKERQVTMRKEDRIKDMSSRGAIPPYRRRSSVTRMSVDQKQNVVRSNAEEEREIMRNKVVVEEDRKSESSEAEESADEESGSSESSSDSETEKKNEINRQTTLNSNHGNRQVNGTSVVPTSIIKERDNQTKPETPTAKIEETKDIKAPPPKPGGPVLSGPTPIPTPRIQDLAKVDRLQNEADKENERLTERTSNKNTAPADKVQKDASLRKDNLLRKDREERDDKKQDDKSGASESLKGRVTSALAGESLDMKNRSYAPPARDEEKEVERKARARRARETRRSTQGITHEDLVRAEAELKAANDKETSDRDRLSSDDRSDKENKPEAAKSLSSLRNRVTSDTKPTDDLSSHRKNIRDPALTSDSCNISSSYSHGLRASGSITTNSITGGGTTSSRSSTAATSSVPTATTTTTVSSSGSSLTPYSTRPYRSKYLSNDDSENSSGPQRKDDAKSEDKSKEQDKDESPSQKSSAIRRRKRESRRCTAGVNPDDIKAAKKEDETETKEKTREDLPTSRYGSNRHSDISGSSYDTSSARAYPRGGDRPSSYHAGSGYSRSQSSTSLPDRDIDYKRLYEEQKAENEKLRKDVKKLQQELSDTKVDLEKVRLRSEPSRNSETAAERKEKRTLERKISELEEELRQMENLKQDNQRLKEENGALIRVISKLSK